MRVILLAAGQGVRLRPHTNQAPKALVPLDNDTPLLGHTLRLLEASPDVAEVVVVTGYCAERIDQYLAKAGLRKVRTVFNERYAGSGPVHSVWRGLGDFGGPTAIMNGDTYFERRALWRMMRIARESSTGAMLFGSRTTSPLPDDVKVDLAGRLVKEVGKKLPVARTSMRSAGVFVTSRGEIDRLRSHILPIVTDRAQDPKTWHELVNMMVGSGAKVRAVALPPQSWREVDCPVDLEQTQLTYRRQAMRFGVPARALAS